MESSDAAADHRHRIDRLRDGLDQAGLDALLVTPGATLRYLTGYVGNPTTERITCFVLTRDGLASLLVPRLEEPLAVASVPAGLDLPVITWAETEDSLARLVDLLPTSTRHVAVDERMWAGRSLRLRALRPDVEQVTATALVDPVRMRKSPREVAALRRAGAAIDSVHAAMGQWLRPGRTEREVGADVADAILASGHESAEFVIVASGPNAASPHADVSDRAINPGELVVVDIGGTMPDGYNSDSTRTYVVGEPDAEQADYYAVLLEAQRRQCEAVRPGLGAAELDAIGRRIITDAGYGDRFIHRTGHGIGLDTHEQPYIVEGNDLVLEPGMAFSIEPGIYFAGASGARIEDIVVCTQGEGERLNLRPRELAVL